MIKNYLDRNTGGEYMSNQQNKNQNIQLVEQKAEQLIEQSSELITGQLGEVITEELTEEKSEQVISNQKRNKWIVI